MRRLGSGFLAKLSLEYVLAEGISPLASGSKVEEAREDVREGETEELESVSYGSVWTTRFPPLTARN